jgi:hypothetical protein
MEGPAVQWDSATTLIFGEVRGIRHSPRKGCADDNVQWFITC